MDLDGSKKGYYGLIRYIQGHERYCYLLGIEVAQENTIPESAVLMKVPKATYAMARFSQGEDIIKAWAEFFYHQIPKAGLEINDEHNLYFEYYPDSVCGEFELWVPVVKTDV